MADFDPSWATGVAPAREAAPGIRKLLVVADESPECRVALRYAALRAHRTGGRLTLLYVIEPGEFQHWVAVAERMREEAREEAERLLYELCGEANRIEGLMPELVIREGDLREEILAVVREDPAIRLLVLGAAASREGPGPLVASLTSQALAAYPIPVTVVPGGLAPDAIDALA